MINNLVAIVGRPNVGKSTLFNRLTERRDAIVKEVSGVTRDRIYGKSEWNGKEFSVVDTGGYVRGSDDIFEEEIRKQVEIAIEEAKVILFVVDVTSGITDLDESVAMILRKSNKDVILCVNKVDTGKLSLQATEFYSLGMGDYFEVSSINGSGTGDLLDEVVKHVEPEPEREEDYRPKIAIVGKPNVGKSSFLNALVGEERNIVTDISGTTRDSINTRFQAFGYDFDLIDTAGIRKKAKVHEDIEYYSVVRSIRSIENADVCIMMVDATEGIQKQDLNIYYMIEKNKKGVVLLMNKWDLYDKEDLKIKEVEDHIREQLAPFNDVPIVFTSALTKQRILKAVEIAMQVYKNKSQRITTSKLNELMQEVVAAYPPPSVKGKEIKIKYVTQLPTTVPSFAFFCNLPQYIGAAYKRYLEKQLRKNFDFTGVPIRIYFRKKS